MALIETKGFEVLTNQEILDFNRIIEEHSKKIQRKMKNIESFIIHIKEHKNPRKTKEFSINARLRGSKNIFEASSNDWDFRKALHKVFTGLENEIEHTFHVSDQHKPRRRD